MLVLLRIKYRKKRAEYPRIIEPHQVHLRPARHEQKLLEPCSHLIKTLSRVRQKDPRQGLFIFANQIVTSTGHIAQINQGRPHLPPLLKIRDRKSTRLNSSHVRISYAVFCLKKKIS